MPAGSIHNGNDSHGLLPLWILPDCKTVLEHREDAVTRKCPTTTAQNHGKRCRCGIRHNWGIAIEHLEDGEAGKRTATPAPNRRKCCRCGSCQTVKPTKNTVTTGYRETYCHTGTKSRKMLPVRKTRAMATPLRGTSRAIHVFRPLPHRHRIAGNAASVEAFLTVKPLWSTVKMGLQGNVLPHRHRIAGIAAVVVGRMVVWDRMADLPRSGLPKGNSEV